MSDGGEVNKMFAIPPRSVLKKLGMTMEQYLTTKAREAQGLLEGDLQNQYQEEHVHKSCHICGTVMTKIRYRCWECPFPTTATNSSPMLSSMPSSTALASLSPSLCGSCFEAQEKPSSPHYGHLITQDDVDMLEPGRGGRVEAVLQDAFRKFGPRPMFGISKEKGRDAEGLPGWERGSIRNTHLDYHFLSYSDVLLYSTWFYHGLHASGFPGGMFGLAAPNRIHWILCDVACLLNSIPSVPIHILSSAQEIAAIVSESEIGGVLCHAELTGVFVALAQSPSSNLKVVIQIENNIDEVHAKSGVVVRFAEVMERGRLVIAQAADAPQQQQHEPVKQDGSEKAQEPQVQVQEASELSNNSNLTTTSNSIPNSSGLSDRDRRDLLTIIYTSGSTGTPKGVMISNMAWRFIMTRVGLLPYTMVEVVFQPLAHMNARMQYLQIAVQGGHAFLFEAGISNSDGSGGFGRLFDVFREVRPTQLGAIPRLWSMVYQEFRRTVGIQATLNNHLPAAQQISTEVIEQGVMSNIRSMFGDRLMAVSTGSAATPPEVMKWMKKCFAGLDCTEGYGATETGSMASMGKELRDVSVRLRDCPELGYLTTDLPKPRGEIIAQSPARALGYYKQPELTKEVFLEGGWYATGDIGQQEPDGRIIIIDRCKNLFKLAQGEFVVPAKIEAILEGSKFIRQIVVHGNIHHDHVVAVTVVDKTLLAQHLGKGNDEEWSVTANPEALKAVLDDLFTIGRVNGLQPYEIPRRVWVEEKEEWTAQNKKLTPSNKINRPVLLKTYKEQLLSLYEEEDRRAGAEPDAKELLALLRDVCAPSSAPLSDDKLNSASLLAQGVDSFAAVRLSDKLMQQFHVKVPVSLLLSETTTLEDIRAHLHRDPASTTSTATSSSVVQLPRFEYYDWVEESQCPTLAEAPEGLDWVAPFSTQPQLLWNHEDKDAAVLLTGATGFLGCHLVDQILTRTAAHLWCLVRGSTNDQARERLVRCLKDQLVWKEDYAQRISVVAGDIGDVWFGLSPSTYKDLASKCTVVIHNAARVNHALPYGDLRKDNVLGTAQVLKFSVAGNRKLLVHISTASTSDGEGRLRLPETLPGAIGYVQSKWVAERMVQRANETWNLPCVVFGPGVVSGHSQTGACNPGDMITRVLFGVSAMRTAPVMPPSHGVMLAPVDYVAGAIVALSVDVQHFSTKNNLVTGSEAVDFNTLVEMLNASGAQIASEESYSRWLELVDQQPK